MRPGSTLIPELIPDARGCLYEQPLALPAGSGQRTVFHLASAMLIPLGVIAMLDGNVLIVLVFALIPKLTPIVMLIACTLVASSFAPLLVPEIVGLAVVALQAFLFAKHAIHLATAAPCRPGDSIRVRARARGQLAWAVALLPLTTLWGTLCVLAHPACASAAWVSYLNYNHGEVRAPATFESPAGPYWRRILLFRSSVVAATVALIPPPAIDVFGLFRTEPLVLDFAEATRLVLACFLPAFLVIAVSTAMLGPFLPILRRIRDDA